MTNPLLAEWTTPFGLPPFAQISDDHFQEAFDAAIEAERVEISDIANSPDAPTFENTIEALEGAGHQLMKVLGAFYAKAGAHTNPALQALERAFSPRLAALSSEILGNKALFARIDDLWARKDDLGLSDEQERVLMLTRRGFVRGGAGLGPDQEARLRDVMGRLAVLGTSFTQNLLADEAEWFMPLGPDDLEGLPQFLVDAATAAAEEKRKETPIITTSRSLIVPFLQFSPRRALRERAYRAWTARGANGGKTDNRAIVTETLALRHERAQLLGYGTFSGFKLETEMAKTPGRVRDLLMRVWDPARAKAMEDAAILETMLHADGIDGPLQPWDWHYYSARRRKAEHDLDEAELKPYFQLDNMIEAAFDCATRLFGLEFNPVDVPLYHDDCRAWEVTRCGEHVALFIGDYFARGSKRSGAWCSAMRKQAKRPRAQTPIVINVCNFAKPKAGQPALLSYDDARTLFHEFGHALHQMLSDVTYGSVSGTSVSRDFVELPSQLYEHWLEVPEVLEKYATHAQTGQAMPADLMAKVLGAATYDMGFQTVEFIASAMVDLEFHNAPPPADPMQKQAEVLDKIGMPAAISMRHATPHFAHAFAGDGYSSGYYSYMWSEVMDADAFDAFKEVDDPFDPAIAARLAQFILSTGGSQDAEALYTQFRGRMPEVDALLRGRGLAA